MTHEIPMSELHEKHKKRKSIALKSSVKDENEERMGIFLLSRKNGLQNIFYFCDFLSFW